MVHQRLPVRVLFALLVGVLVTGVAGTTLATPRSATAQSAPVHIHIASAPINDDLVLDRLHAVASRDHARTLRHLARIRAAKRRAAREAAEARIEAQRAAEARSAASQSALKRYALSLVGADQFGCLDALWSRESGWQVHDYNSSSGAYGIPQALPGSKMASAGADWEDNGYTQIDWGVAYIRERYGTPCGAWAHSQATGWY